MESTSQNIRKAGIIVPISPPPNGGRVFNSSFTLYLFQFADNLINVINDITILRCAGVLCKDLYVGNTQNISKPQLKAIKLQIQMFKRCQDVCQDFIKPHAFFQSTLNHPYLP